MEIKYIEPSALHDEMLRLRKEEQMDFLECLSGMDWGMPDEKMHRTLPVDLAWSTCWSLLLPANG